MKPAISKPELVVRHSEPEYDDCAEESFHADTYCFDSRPEKELFNQLVYSGKTEEVFSTGMFTSGQSELAIQYVDPESRRIRSYYPDFYIKKSDGMIELIEVKGDNKIDDETVLAKAAAARDIADASNIAYGIIGGNCIMENDVTAMSPKEAQEESIALARGVEQAPNATLFDE